MPRWEKTKFTHEFVGKGEEALIDIFKRQFVRYVNDKMGFSYLTLKKRSNKEEFLSNKNIKGNGYAAYILEPGVELTDRIMEMVEGESPEVLEEIVRLLNYHAGYKARIFTGNESFEKIMMIDI